MVAGHLSGIGYSGIETPAVIGSELVYVIVVDAAFYKLLGNVKSLSIFINLLIYKDVADRGNVLAHIERYVPVSLDCRTYGNAAAVVMALVTVTFGNNIM